MSLDSPFEKMQRALRTLKGDLMSVKKKPTNEERQKKFPLLNVKSEGKLAVYET